jgi:hypothetical protein
MKKKNYDKLLIYHKIDDELIKNKFRILWSFLSIVEKYWYKKKCLFVIYDNYIII